MERYRSIKKAQMGFFDGHIERRTAKNRFFKQVDTLIDWAPIEKELKKVYKKGLKQRGAKAYGPLLLFKMQLVSVWYGLSDVQVEEMANENLSVMRFLGLSLEDDVPDHSTLSRFRKELARKRAYDRILKKVNAQLFRHKLMVKGGAKVDASLTHSPFSPKGATTYEMARDREEDDRPKKEKDREEAYHMEKQEQQPGADNDARWVKKGGKSVYGYKKHMATDRNGMVLGVHTCPANEHDSRGLGSLVKKVPKTQRRQVMADKGYKSAENDRVLKENGSKSRIMHKAQRNKPLTDWQKKYNKMISKTRWAVERTFGSLKRWFGSGTTRLKGLDKVHGLHVIEAIAHNLKRSPGLVRQMAG